MYDTIHLETNFEQYITKKLAMLYITFEAFSINIMTPF